MDELQTEEELDYCKYGCGKSIHKNCFVMWTKKNLGNCVYCRTDWIIKENKTKGKNGYGNYINIFAEINQEIPKRTNTRNGKIIYFFCI